jgi:hypothetical protein
MKDYKYAIRLSRKTSKAIDFSSGSSLKESGESFQILKYSPDFSVVQYKRKNQYQFGKYHEPHWVAGAQSIPKSQCPTKQEAMDHFTYKWVYCEWRRKPEFNEAEVLEKAFNNGAWFKWLVISNSGASKHNVKTGEKVIDNKNSLSCYEEYPAARLFFKTEDEFMNWFGKDNYKELFASLI